MSKFKTFIIKLLRREDGATAIEYALLAALIAVAIMVSAGNLGTQIAATFTTVTTKLSGG